MKILDVHCEIDDGFALCGGNKVPRVPHDRFVHLRRVLGDGPPSRRPMWPWQRCPTCVTMISEESMSEEDLVSSRRDVTRFWLQTTVSFPEGAPQRESYFTDAAYDRADVKYASEWRAAYRCAGCDDVTCPQCGAANLTKQRGR